MRPKIVQRVRTFLSELRRRRVYRVAALYAVVAVGGLELLDVLIPASNLPPWADVFFLGLAIVGFPLVIVLAWVFDFGPEGVHKTADPPRTSTGSPPTASPPSGDSDPAPSGDPGQPPSPEDLDPKAIAVLPFENLSGAPDAEPFAAGLHDDLLTELSRVASLTVISRTSVRGYRESSKTITTIGRELGAGTILEGGIQKAGGRVRLNVQLIDARSDVHLWAERYDRELSAETIFELQTELASSIMSALHAKLTVAEEQHVGRLPTKDLEAYRHFSIGRAHLVDRSEPALRSAVEHFEAAVARDPEYAVAWAHLSTARTAIVDYLHTDSTDLLEAAEEAADRALELDPELAEAHSARGALFAARYRAADALDAHARAIALRPGYAGAYQWHCWASLLIGRPRQALASGRRATRLDPLDPEAAGNVAMSLLGVGEHTAALEIARATVARHEGFEYARWTEALALLELGRLDEARREMERLSDRWSRPWGDTGVAVVHAARGEVAEVRRIAAKHRGEGRPVHAGLAHALVEETDEAFAAILDADVIAWPESLALRYLEAPPVAGLRSDARYGALTDRLDRIWGARGAD